MIFYFRIYVNTDSKIQRCSTKIAHSTSAHANTDSSFCKQYLLFQHKICLLYDADRGWEVNNPRSLVVPVIKTMKQMTTKVTLMDNSNTFLCCTKRLSWKSSQGGNSSTVIFSTRWLCVMQFCLPNFNYINVIAFVIAM